MSYIVQQQNNSNQVMLDNQQNFNMNMQQDQPTQSTSDFEWLNLMNNNQGNEQTQHWQQPATISRRPRANTIAVPPSIQHTNPYMDTQTFQPQQQPQPQQPQMVNNTQNMGINQQQMQLQQQQQQQQQMQLQQQQQQMQLQQQQQQQQQQIQLQQQQQMQMQQQQHMMNQQQLISQQQQQIVNQQQQMVMNNSNQQILMNNNQTSQPQQQLLVSQQPNQQNNNMNSPNLIQSSQQQNNQGSPFSIPSRPNVNLIQGRQRANTIPGSTPPPYPPQPSNISHFHPAGTGTSVNPSSTLATTASTLSTTTTTTSTPTFTVNSKYGDKIPIPPANPKNSSSKLPIQSHLLGHPNFSGLGQYPMMLLSPNSKLYGHDPYTQSEHLRKLDEELEKIDFDDITVYELKEMLRKRGLPSSGKKALLTERLLDEKKNAEVRKRNFLEAEEKRKKNPNAFQSLPGLYNPAQMMDVYAIPPNTNTIQQQPMEMPLPQTQQNTVSTFNTTTTTPSSTATNSISDFSSMNQMNGLSMNSMNMMNSMSGVQSTPNPNTSNPNMNNNSNNNNSMNLSSMHQAINQINMNMNNGSMMNMNGNTNVNLPTTTTTSIQQPIVPLGIKNIKTRQRSYSDSRLTRPAFLQYDMVNMTKPMETSLLHTSTTFTNMNGGIQQQQQPQQPFNAAITNQSSPNPAPFGQVNQIMQVQPQQQTTNQTTTLYPQQQIQQNYMSPMPQQQQDMTNDLTMFDTTNTMNGMSKYSDIMIQ